MTTLTWTLDSVDAEKMKTLALILTDPNPIHFDAEAAAKLGAGGRVVNQGPSTIALIYNLFTAQLPSKRVKRLDVRLLGNVLAGEKVTVEATPRSTEAGAAIYDVRVVTDDGAKLAAVAHLVERS